MITDRIAALIQRFPRATEAQRYELMRTLRALLTEPGKLVSCADERILAKCSGLFKKWGGVTSSGVLIALQLQRSNLRYTRQALGALQDPSIPLHEIWFDYQTDPNGLQARIALCNLNPSIRQVFQVERERQSNVGWEGLPAFVSHLFDQLVLLSEGALYLRPLAEGLAWGVVHSDPEIKQLWGLFLHGKQGVAERLFLSVVEEGMGDITLLATRVAEGEEGERFKASVKQARWAAVNYLKRLSVTYDVEILLSCDILLKIGHHYHAEGFEGASLGLPIAVMLVAHALRLSLPQDVSLTGEISAEGQVSPVDGLSEKIKAAEQQAVKRIYAPAGNVNEISSTTRGIELVGIRSMDEVCSSLFRETFQEKGYRAFPLAAATQARSTESLPFVGRESDLTWLKQHINRTLSGQGRLAVVNGAAGVGKTRLLEEAKQYARGCGMTVLTGRCVAHEGVLPCTPLIEAISGIQEADALRLQLSEHISAVQDGLKRARASQDTDRSALHLYRSQLTDSIAAFLSVLAQQTGSVVCIEDIHWGDTGTIDLLYQLARWNQDRRICFIVTYRTEESPIKNHKIGTVFQETLQRCAEEGLSETLELIPLSESECTKLVVALLDESVVPVWLTDAMYRRTQGNPLFVVETLKWWKDQGLKTGISLDWRQLETIMDSLPPRIHDLILRRLSFLRPEERELLELAAVGGDRFDSEVVLAIVEGSRLDTLRRIQRFERDCGLLLPVEGTEYSFSHSRIQEVLYSQVSPPLRREYHTAWSKELLARKEQGVEVSTESLARHLGAGNSPMAAIPFLLDAADQALKLCAFREAGKLWEQVLSIVDQSPSTNEIELQRLESFLGLGRVNYELGGWGTAQDYNEKALHLTQELREIDLQARSLHQSGAVFAAQNNWNHAVIIFQQSIALYERSENLVGIASISNLLGNIDLFQGKLKQANTHYLKALSICKKINDDNRIAAVTNNLGILQLAFGNEDGAIQYHMKARCIFQENKNLLGVATASANLGMVYERKRNWENAEFYHGESISLLESMTQSRILWIVYLNYARVLARTENIYPARKYLAKANALLAVARNPPRGLAEAKRVEGLIASLEMAWEDSDSLFNESERLCLEVKDQTGYAETIEERGLMLARKGDTLSAIGCLKQAKSEYKKIKAKGSECNIQRLIAELKEPNNLMSPHSSSPGNNPS